MNIEMAIAAMIGERGGGILRLRLAERWNAVGDRFHPGQGG